MSEQNQVVVFRGDMTKMQPEFAKALPAHITADKFVRTVLTAVQNQPDLMQAERQSVLSSCMKATSDGLIIDGKEAALVTFNTRRNRGNGFRHRCSYGRSSTKHLWAPLWKAS